MKFKIRNQNTEHVAVVDDSIVNSREDMGNPIQVTEEAKAGVDRMDNYRDEVKKALDAEVIATLKDEMEKAAKELVEEQKKAIRQMVEEHKAAIWQVVEEERRRVWDNAEEIRRSITRI